MLATLHFQKTCTLCDSLWSSSGQLVDVVAPSSEQPWPYLFRSWPSLRDRGHPSSSSRSLPLLQISQARFIERRRRSIVKYVLIRAGSPEKIWP